MDRILALSAYDDQPAVHTSRAISLVSSADLRQHAPDLHLLAVHRGAVVARCSCWWEGRRGGAGAIGHYAAVNAESGRAILDEACRALAAAGCVSATGPLDGNTWRRYRLIVDRCGEPPFFLEPDNPDDWPLHWSDAGFSPCAAYSSAVNEDLATRDLRTEARLARLETEGIAIRAFDARATDADLHRIFTLSAKAFERNPFYGEIAESEFVAQYRAILPLVRPELILLAERGDTLAGFIFAVPDALEARRGAPPLTVIVKTLAVAPELAGLGLGGVLMDLVQRQAFTMGFRRAIHALMHDTNVSRRISGRYARTMRRYALFSRSIGRGLPTPPDIES